MIDRQQWRYFDWPLLIAVSVLCLIGIAVIYSATINTIDLNGYWIRQVIFISMGLVALFIAALFDYRHLEMFALPAFIVFIGLLIAVLAVGSSQGGSQRWISVAGTLVQPTEAGKFLLIVFMAWYLSRVGERLERLPYLIGTFILLVAPLVLIYRQPDLGMTVTFAVIGGVQILIAGIQFWHVGLMAMGLLAVLPFFQRTLSGYMLDRINMFFNPEAFEAEVFNVEQALIAVGNGGWLGQGWGYGSQNQGHFLRVRHTDFIFSVIAEELGLIGAALIVALLLFVVWRLLRISDIAQDQFGRLIAIGVAVLIFFQVVINVGMNLNIVPVTGLTLPFISYGGSSLLSMMFAIGLAQSVSMRHKKIEFQ